MTLNAWLNIYKPTGISSAQVVGAISRIIKAYTGIKPKIGHAGTLDVEAEGILPLAIGEATKLVAYIMDAKKTYRFKIQFGTRTDTADRVGQVIATTDIFPTKDQCFAVVTKFIGSIEQIPPAFSALKIAGRRAYDMARAKEIFELKPRIITIFDIKCLGYDEQNHIATYEATCSKGTYIRTLGEDIAFSLQSLGFVLELARKQVGIFVESTSISFTDLVQMTKDDAAKHLIEKTSRIDAVLDDILVLDVDDILALKVKYGQMVTVDRPDTELLWLRHHDNLLAIGKILQGRFYSSRVFNL